jgi:hypothetical protein
MLVIQTYKFFKASEMKMNFKKVFQVGVGVAALIAINTHAGQYMDYQIKYLQQASIEEANENDNKGSNYFTLLASTAAEKNRHMEVADLPAHWQSSPQTQNGLTTQYGPRLLELEDAIASMSLKKRETHAEQVARLQVCLFHVRHEMSETSYTRGKSSDSDTARYMSCAETAYEELNKLPIPRLVFNDDLPPAKPGECYARVYTPTIYNVEKYDVIKKPASFRVEITPAVYETVEVTRLVKETSTTITEVPSVYETITETVMIKEASNTITEIPATYKIVKEPILVKEASTRLEEVPAVFEWVEERVIDTPAHTAWKEGGKIVEKIDGRTSEAVCLVEVPATYKTLKKRVMTSPATTRTIAIPAEYKTVSKQVVDKPATTKITEIPAEFMTIKKRVVKIPETTKVTQVPAEYKVEKVQKLVTPARSEKISIPAEYEAVTKTHIVTPSKMEWRQVLCDINLTAERVNLIQEALVKAGYNPGETRGELNTQTLDVILKFQQDNNLSTGGITLETVHLLETNI